jgi:hypothetical protein
MLAAAVAATALAVGAGGCGTTYQPRPSARVGLVVEHGGARYLQNGRKTPVGVFSGPLQELVAATPAAAAHAHTAHTELAVGVPCYVTGLAAVVLSLTLLSGPVGWVVLGVGASTGVTGLGLMGAGVTHAVDAVNIHNDHVSQPP